MIFVDTNVFMYAVGREHPLRRVAREFLGTAILGEAPLCTSAEVLQELMHAYLPVGRVATLDAALTLVVDANVEVWPLEAADVHLARHLRERFPALSARDLCCLASCQRRGVTTMRTFDAELARAFGEHDPI